MLLLFSWQQKHQESDLWNVLFIVTRGTADFRRGMAKYSIAIRIGVLSLHGRTEAQEMQLRRKTESSRRNWEELPVSLHSKLLLFS